MQRLNIILLIAVIIAALWIGWSLGSDQDPVIKYVEKETVTHDTLLIYKTQTFTATPSASITNDAGDVWEPDSSLAGFSATTSKTFDQIYLDISYSPFDYQFEIDLQNNGIDTVYKSNTLKEVKKEPSWITWLKGLGILIVGFFMGLLGGVI